MAQKKKMEQDIKDLFKLFDKDTDNMISKKELKMVLCEFGNPTEQEIRDIYTEMGVKQDERIKFEQFSKCIETYHKRIDISRSKEELMDSFKCFDKDNNGTIDKKELKKVLISVGEKLTDADVDQMFKKVDANNDGKIQYKEFVTMLTTYER